MTDALPDYDDLPQVPGLDVRHAWDVFGRDDVLGSINLVTPERVARAAAGVVDRRADPARPAARRPGSAAVRAPRRTSTTSSPSTATSTTTTSTCSTRRARRSGTRSATCAAASTASGAAARDNPTDGPIGLGIDHWARHGIAGRGVLIDVAAHLVARDPSYDPLEPRAITVDELAGHARRRRRRARGRRHLVRAHRLGRGVPASSTAPRASAYAEAPHFAGLRADEAMARFVWNAHPAALCCDNPAVEVVPGDPGRRVAAPPPAADARDRARRDVRLRAAGRRPATPTAAARSCSSPPRCTSRTASARPATPSPSAE